MTPLTVPAPKNPTDHLVLSLVAHRQTKGAVLQAVDGVQGISTDDTNRVHGILTASGVTTGREHMGGVILHNIIVKAETAFTDCKVYGAISAPVKEYVEAYYSRTLNDDLGKMPSVGPS